MSDNSILFEDGPDLVRCSGCGRYFEKDLLKNCRICRELFCSECQKTHDCRDKQYIVSQNQMPSGTYVQKTVPVSPSISENTGIIQPAMPEIPHTHIHPSPSESAIDSILLNEDELRCEQCGNVFKKSELRRCQKCGMVLCSSCRQGHQYYCKSNTNVKNTNHVVPVQKTHHDENNDDRRNAPENRNSTCKSDLPMTSKGTIVTGHKSVFLSFLLGFFIIGAGYMYAGKVGKGLLFLLFSVLFCWTVLVPIILWIVGIVKAVKLCKENNIIWAEYAYGR